MNKKSFLFAVPALLIYTALLIVPILMAFGLSFTGWNGISADIRWTGLKNYADMLADKRFLNAAGVTLKIVAAVCVSVNVTGLFLAVLLSRTKRFTNVLRGIFFMPFVLSGVAVSFIWLAILSYTGVLNSFLEAVGLGALRADYIGNTRNALRSICIVEIWRTAGFYMVIYLTAIRGVPPELYEACTIDGGSRWQQFRYITLPLIVPGIVICSVMSVMAEMKQYDVVNIITNGGPGYSTETITYNIVDRAFGGNMLGYSSAMAVVLFAAIAVLSILQIRIFKRWEV